MNWRKFIHNLFHKSKPGGLVMEPIGDAVSPKFQNYRKNHGKEIFGAVIPKTLGKAEELIKKEGYPRKFFPFQNSVLSCVHASIAFVKNVYTDFNYFFTWRWTYGKVPHFEGGTRLKDGMAIAKEEGMLLDNYLPQNHYWGGEWKMQTIWLLVKNAWHKATIKEVETLSNLAEKFKLGKFEYIYAKDRVAIKHAIMNNKVVIFGVYIQDENWYNNGIIYWKTNGRVDGGHAICGYDWDDDGKFWYIPDWDGNGFKKLNYNYPLLFVAVPENGKDKELNPMLRVIKLADDTKYWVVWADNTKSHIDNWELYQWGIRKGIWVANELVEVVKEEDFNAIPTDDDSTHLLKIIDEFNKSQT